VRLLPIALRWAEVVKCPDVVAAATTGRRVCGAAGGEGGGDADVVHIAEILGLPGRVVDGA
jgi:hypothetical protein